MEYNKEKDIQRLHSLDDLIQFVDSNNHRGYDPYDALNSSLLKTISAKSKWLRILFTQLLRRLPINIRPILGIRKEHNPKAMGLFLSAYVNLQRLSENDEYRDRINFFTDWLIKNSSPGYSGDCWGYNFDWQNREFYAPEGTPTIVNTAFIAHAFLDAYDLFSDDHYLNTALSACDFILNDLNIHTEDDTHCFSYTPIDHGRVHNANYLGASLMVRTHSKTGEAYLLKNAVKSYEFSNHYQEDNGAWQYGAEGTRQWVDGFHTGFNLEALDWYRKSTGDDRYTDIMENGLRFYIENFFLDDGTPGYYADSIYPVDIHSAAQAIITLAKLSDLDNRAELLAQKVLHWTVTNMMDPDGYFYYRKGRILTNKLPYIRWGQAWMMKALSTYSVLKKLPEEVA